MTFDPQAYRADLAQARKLAKARGLELFGMRRTPAGRYEGMLRWPEKAPPPQPADADDPSSGRGVFQGQLL